MTAQALEQGEMTIMRFQVWDELGLLRAFSTRREADKFLLPEYKLVILPRPKKPTYLQVYQSLVAEAGDCPF